MQEEEGFVIIESEFEKSTKEKIQYVEDYKGSAEERRLSLSKEEAKKLAQEIKDSLFGGEGIIKPPINNYENQLSLEPPEREEERRKEEEKNKQDMIHNPQFSPSLAELIFEQKLKEKHGNWGDPQKVKELVQKLYKFAGEETNDGIKR